jgi:hypothetical protein
METLVCSYKPRPSVQNGRTMFKTGECVWGRDIHHALKSPGKTYCGVDTYGWCVINEEVPTDAALKDFNLCQRCARKMRKP